MLQGVKREQTDGSESNDLQPYHQLIELQKQMMELVEQNAEAERKCMALRQMLAREAEAMFLSRLGFRHRLQKSASKIFSRLLRRRASMAANLRLNGGPQNTNGSRNERSLGTRVVANANLHPSTRNRNRR